MSYDVHSVELYNLVFDPSVESKVAGSGAVHHGITTYADDARRVVRCVGHVAAVPRTSADPSLWRHQSHPVRCFGMRTMGGREERLLFCSVAINTKSKNNAHSNLTLRPEDADSELGLLTWQWLIDGSGKKERQKKERKKETTELTTWALGAAPSCVHCCLIKVQKWGWISHWKHDCS